MNAKTLEMIAAKLPLSSDTRRRNSPKSWQCDICGHRMTEEESMGYRGCPTGFHVSQHQPISGGPQETAAEARPAGPDAQRNYEGPRAAGRRVRQRTKPKLNKLEAEWLRVLEAMRPHWAPFGIKVRSQALTFLLANGVRYTPDFVSTSGKPAPEGAWGMTAWEVKGPRAWDDALVKLKVAAHEWPEVRWVLVWKKDGKWQEQEILP